MNENKGKLILYSGASGVGKGSILKRLTEVDPSVKLSVSCTTRERREGEAEGVNYYYVTREKFLDMVKNGEFLEWAEYCDNLYGTPIAPLREFVAQGYNVVLEIEVQGAIQVMEKYPDILSIFILPPSFEELEKRLRGRETEDEETIAKRLEQARLEISLRDRYKFCVVNKTLEKACDEVFEIIHNN